MAREPRGDVADLLALVADALQVGDGLDDGDDQAQVAGRRRARREDAAAFLVDRHFHAVDLEVVAADRHAEIAVAFDERGHGVGELLLDHAAHGQHLVAHALEVFVEAARDVVRKIGGFHDDPQDSRPRTRTAQFVASDDAAHDIRRWRPRAARARVRAGNDR